jgi:hypothetical protein
MVDRVVVKLQIGVDAEPDVADASRTSPPSSTGRSGAPAAPLHARPAPAGSLFRDHLFEHLADEVLAVGEPLVGLVPGAGAEGFGDVAFGVGAVEVDAAAAGDVLVAEVAAPAEREHRGHACIAFFARRARARALLRSSRSSPSASDAFH